jgi:hypothetical protein
MLMNSVMAQWVLNSGTISTAEGLHISHYVMGKLMLNLNFMSCQLLKHRFINKGGEHNMVSNHLNRESTVDRFNHVLFGGVTYI